MAHQINWCMGHRVIYAALDGESLTLASLQALNDQLMTFVEDADPMGIHLIIDASGLRTLRTDVAALHAGFAFTTQIPVGWIVLVSDDPVTRYLRALITRVTRLPMRNFEALEEALFFLQDEDRSLQQSFWSAYEPAASF